ncbi:MAG: hypothetical protein AAFX45_04965 [Pseudomonadota bacterium]
MFFKRDLSHVLSLDPTNLGLTRTGMCWYAATSGRPLDRRKVWGERCSGTNFAGALLHRHFPDLARKGGQIEWKHGLARPGWSASTRLNLFVVRDPFTWAQSFYRNPWHLPQRLRDRDFGAFIRDEWVGVFYDQGKNTPERPADRHPVDHRRFRDIWEMRAVKLRHALVAAAEIPNGVFVRYEDLSSDPETFIADIAAQFDLPVPVYQPITDYKGEARKAYDATRYAPMDPSDRAHILSRLDPALEGFFDYLPRI